MTSDCEASPNQPKTLRLMIEATPETVDHIFDLARAGKLDHLDVAEIEVDASQAGGPRSWRSAEQRKHEKNSDSLSR